MTIQDLGSIADVIAAVATVAGLVYVAVQIRQNTRAVRANTHHAVSNSYITVNSWVACDPSLARLFRVGRDDLAALDEDERVQFDFMLLSVFQVYETIYFQHMIGTAEEQLFANFEHDVAMVLKAPGVRQWFRETPFAFSPGFRAYITSRILAEQGPWEDGDDDGS